MRYLDDVIELIAKSVDQAPGVKVGLPNARRGSFKRPPSVYPDLVNLVHGHQKPSEASSGLSRQPRVIETHQARRYQCHIGCLFIKGNDLVSKYDRVVVGKLAQGAQIHFRFAMDLIQGVSLGQLSNEFDELVLDRKSVV